MSQRLAKEHSTTYITSGVSENTYTDSTEKLIYAFVTGRLDYCNGILYGLPGNLTPKLQRV